MIRVIDTRAIIINLLVEYDSNECKVKDIIDFYKYLYNELRFKRNLLSIYSIEFDINEYSLERVIEFNPDLFTMDNNKEYIRLNNNYSIEELTRKYRLTITIKDIIKDFVNKQGGNKMARPNRNTTNISSEMDVIKKQIDRFKELKYDDGYNVYENNVLYPFLGVDEEDFYKIRDKVVEMLTECYKKKADEMIAMCETLKNSVKEE